MTYLKFTTDLTREYEYKCRTIVYIYTLFVSFARRPWFNRTHKKFDNSHISSKFWVNHYLLTHKKVSMNWDETFRNLSWPWGVTRCHRICPMWFVFRKLVDDADRSTHHTSKRYSYKCFDFILHSQLYGHEEIDRVDAKQQTIKKNAPQK